jgi:hypothetical protein
MREAGHQPIHARGASTPLPGRVKTGDHSRYEAARRDAWGNSEAGNRGSKTNRSSRFTPAMCGGFGGSCSSPLPLGRGDFEIRIWGSAPDPARKTTGQYLAAVGRRKPKA